MQPNSLGKISVTTPGTPVQVTTDKTIRANRIRFQNVMVRPATRSWVPVEWSRPPLLAWSRISGRPVLVEESLTLSRLLAPIEVTVLSRHSILSMRTTPLKD